MVRRNNNIKIYNPKIYPFKEEWKKLKKSGGIIWTSILLVVGFAYIILDYLMEKKNLFNFFIFKTFNIIDILFLLVGVFLFIFVIIKVLIPFIFKPINHYLLDFYKKNKYYNKALQLWAYESKSNCIVNIPRLNISIKGTFNIDFHNDKKIFKEASFKVDEINGNNWRIGIKLLNINRNSEMFFFHP
ncbi:MAG: hypothetical protein U9O59_05815 [Actinomycetota bacterium]|nr:hypothetical protein [Actinomycetota bacterium]